MKPLIVVPTTRSHKYITDSIREYRKELYALQDVYPDADMLVVVNGEGFDNDRVFKSLIAVGHSRRIRIEFSGKNNAINEGVIYAKKYGFDIVHLLDDDVRISKGSIATNVTCLITSSIRLKSRDILTGSKYEPYCDNNDLFALPYQDFHPRRTVSGQSMCFFTDSVPLIPLTDVADDAYLCRWAARSELGTKAIIKPNGSTVYFKPATNLRCWYNQKLRVTTGVLLIHRDEEKALAHCFSYLFKYRKWFNGIPLYFYPRSIALKSLLIGLEIHARWNIRRKKKVVWATVESSKYYK